MAAPPSPIVQGRWGIGALAAFFLFEVSENRSRVHTEVARRTIALAEAVRSRGAPSSSGGASDVEVADMDSVPVTPFFFPGFAGSGVGKSSLMSMITRGTAADVSVIALVGERGREVAEFVERVGGQVVELEHPRAHGIVDVVVEVGDAVGDAKGGRHIV